MLMLEAYIHDVNHQLTIICNFNLLLSQAQTHPYNQPRAAQTCQQHRMSLVRPSDLSWDNQGTRPRLLGRPLGAMGPSIISLWTCRDHRYESPEPYHLTLENPGTPARGSRQKSIAACKRNHFVNSGLV